MRAHGVDIQILDRRHFVGVSPKMMMDAPSNDSESSGETEIVNLEKENANDIMNYVNSLM